MACFGSSTSYPSADLCDFCGGRVSEGPISYPACAPMGYYKRPANVRKEAKIMGAASSTVLKAFRTATIERTKSHLGKD